MADPKTIRTFAVLGTVGLLWAYKKGYFERPNIMFDCNPDELSDRWLDGERIIFDPKETARQIHNYYSNVLLLDNDQRRTLMFKLAYSYEDMDYICMHNAWLKLFGKRGDSLYEYLKFAVPINPNERKYLFDFQRKLQKLGLDATRK